MKNTPKVVERVLSRRVLVCNIMFGKQSPFFTVSGMTDEARVQSISCIVERDHAEFAIAFDDGARSQRRYDLDSETKQFVLRRVMLVVFGEEFNDAATFNAEVINIDGDYHEHPEYRNDCDNTNPNHVFGLLGNTCIIEQ
jgi:hypothetical protein